MHFVRNCFDNPRYGSRERQGVTTATTFTLSLILSLATDACKASVFIGKYLLPV